MFERYTEEAKLAIYYAKAEALQRRADMINTSDIALGIADLKSRSGSPITNLCGHSAKLRALFGVQSRLTQRPGRAEIPLSNQSKIALAYAQEEVTRDGRYAIGPEHILRGVLRTRDDTAIQLAALGFKLRALRRNSKRHHRAAANIRSPVRWRVPTYRVVLYAVIAVLVVSAVLYLRSQN